MERTCSRCRWDVDDGIVLCDLHGMAPELLAACRAALRLLTGIPGERPGDGNLGHHPDNPVPTLLRASIAKASAQEVKP